MKKVCILMATHNGEKFLQSQLNSFLEQTFNNWELFVSDDNSTDCTLKIVENFSQNTSHRVEVRERNYRSFVVNFLSLVMDYEGDADYFAFSDQDDVWNQDKLLIAVHQLEKFDNSKPGLYCSRTEFVDMHAKSYAPKLYSTDTLQKPSFQNALVETIAGGNTMLFNKAALNLLKQFGLVQVSSHDWWLYLLVTGSGGNVYFDPWPSLKYRQHTSNVVGGKKSFLPRFKRFWDGNFKKEVDKNLSALLDKKNLLTEENKLSLNYMILARSSKSILSKVKYFYKSKIYRKKKIFTLALFLGFLFGKC